jgi:hypothetical protein
VSRSAWRAAIRRSTPRWSHPFLADFDGDGVADFTILDRTARQRPRHVELDDLGNRNAPHSKAFGLSSDIK